MEKIASPALNNGRKTIAVLGATMASAYSCGIALGAKDYTLAQGCNVVVFPGGPPNNADILARGRSRIFEFAAKMPFDAMIVTLGSLSRYMTQDQVMAFLQPYRHKPIVIIGAHIEGTASVVVDNVTGIQQVVEHLITVHGKRNIAFAGGQTTHASTMEKLQTYKDVLKKHAIEIDPRYIKHGPLNRHHTDQFINQWLDEDKLAVDAIVTVNDRQAFAIMQYLKERGVRVPEDIAVTGCMDMLECSLSTPTVTTVHEPMYELGWNAARIAIEALEGGDWQAYFEVPTQAIFRQSCGCFDGAGKQQFKDDSKHDFAKLLNDETLPINGGSLDELVTKKLIELTRAAHNQADLKRLLDCVAVEVSKRLNDPNVSEWLAYIADIQYYLFDKWHAAGQYALALNARLQCESLRKRFTKNALNSVSVSVEKSMDAFRELLTSLNSSFDVETLRRLMVREIHINDCYINLYQDNADVTGDVKNILSLSHGISSPPDDDKAIFPAAQLLPANILPTQGPFSLLVMPLSFRVEPIGYAVVDIFDRRGVAYETLQALLASALKNEIQMLEVKAAQVGLMQSEKMAALGSLVAGISHEINTPVGVILTSATVLSEEVDGFRKYIEAGVIKKSELTHYTDQARESAKLIQHNAERAAALIQSFKRVAVDQASEARRGFVLKSYIQEVVLSLQPVLRHSKVQIVLDCDSDVEIDGYPGAMAQIVTNMVNNAIHHAFDADEPGEIIISAHMENDMVRMVFKDNGRGIHEEHIGRVFDPFFTTRRGSGGSGLGLNIVYNLVTQTFGGSITVQSVHGQGVSFVLLFPAVSPVHIRG